MAELLQHWPVDEGSGEIIHELITGNHAQWYGADIAGKLILTNDGTYNCLYGPAGIHYLSQLYPCFTEPYLSGSAGCHESYLTADPFSADWPLAVTGWIRTDQDSGTSVFELGDSYESPSTNPYTYTRNLSIGVLSATYAQTPVPNGRLYADIWASTSAGAPTERNVVRVMSDIRVDDDQWHFFAVDVCVVDGTMRMYIDGVLQSTYGDRSDIVAANSVLGNYAKIAGGRQVWSTNVHTQPGHFEGYARDIRVYDTCLTEEQVRQIYTGGGLTTIIGNCPYPSTSKLCRVSSEAPICASESKVRLIPRRGGVNMFIPNRS